MISLFLYFLNCSLMFKPFWRFEINKANLGNTMKHSRTAVSLKKNELLELVLAKTTKMSQTHKGVFFVGCLNTLLRSCSKSTHFKQPAFASFFPFPSPKRLPLLIHSLVWLYANLNLHFTTETQISSLAVFQIGCRSCSAHSTTANVAHRGA